MVGWLRRRRAVKRALREEAGRVAAVLRSVERTMRYDAAQARADLQSYLTTEPTCPKCGKPMGVRTAQKRGVNGRQFWGCPTYYSCGQQPIELAVYPKAAYDRVVH